MDEHDEKGAHGGRAAAWGRVALYAALMAAVLSCGRSEPPSPSPPDAPPKPKVVHINAVRAGLQPAVFSYTGRTRVPEGHGLLPGPASETPLTI